jgi:AFG3 family protein
LFQERRRLWLASNQHPRGRLQSTAQQEQRPYFSSSTSSAIIDIPVLKAISTRLEDIAKEGFWLIPRKGTGFDNFLPKDKKEQDETEQNSEEKDSKSPEDNKNGEEEKETTNKGEEDLKKWSGGGAFGPFRSSSDNNSSGSSSNNENRPPNFSSTVAAGIIMMAIAYMIMKVDDDGSPADYASREISWNDFCNHLLETGQVEKIVVTNNRTMAKVYLKPGSIGLPSTQPRQFRYSERRHQGGTMEGTNEMNMATTDSFGSTSQDFSRSMKGRPGDHQIVYRFAIGSVDAFEKKLEEAQRVVGMNPSQEIPVQYTAESTVATEVLGVIPSLLLMGAAFYFMRFAAGSMMGGANQGGGGGMGGMFKIGKSTAKKISKEDVKVNFSNVAGCDEAKKEIMEFVDFLKTPSIFTKLGAKIPKGALLCGPPGTGKE